MITVTKRMTTETAHRLIDYVGKCASIHGHSYLWEVTAAREDRGVAPNGIAIDFKELKEAMQEIIYEPFDHALVLAEADPILGLNGGQNFEQASDGGRQKVIDFPVNPTAENFAAHVARELQDYFSRMECGEEPGIASAEDAASTCIDILRVRVWETANSYGEWKKTYRFGGITVDREINVD